MIDDVQPGPIRLAPDDLSRSRRQLERRPVRAGGYETPLPLEERELADLHAVDVPRLHLSAEPDQFLERASDLHEPTGASARLCRQQRVRLVEGEDALDVARADGSRKRSVHRLWLAHHLVSGSRHPPEPARAAGLARSLCKSVDSYTPPPVGMFRSMTGFGGRDMAVDLGTANTLVYVRGRGIVLSEPSVVAIDQRTGDVHAVGVEAKRMLGRTPGTISAIRPLKDGVIADFDVTEQMLRHFIQKVHQHRFAHPRVVVCVPSGVTGVEKRAVEEATLSAGARQAYLIEEPMAAAIGAGLPVAEPTGNMIVDIGGGTTEVAVISLGGIVVSQSLRVGGDEMDEAIVNHIKKEYKLLVGQQTAEEIKLEVGSAHRMNEEIQAEVRGRDMLTGLPKTVVITSEEIRRALDEPVSQIIDAIKSTLDKTPPELAADIMDRGIVLAGGGALLQGLDERLRHETQMPVHLAESPLTCVAVGSGRSLEEFEAIHRSNRSRARRNGARR